MTDDKATLEALDLSVLPVPPGLHVLELKVDDYIDWSGEPALRVQILLDDATDIPGAGEQIDELKRAIHNQMHKHRIPLFPYIFLAKPCELTEAEADCEDSSD